MNFPVAPSTVPNNNSLNSNSQFAINTDLISISSLPPKERVKRWISSNFELADDVSLPRSTVYNLYNSYCTVDGKESINAASFGKLIRSVFPNIKTRRLGERGKSKYHYFGIRIKPTSYLTSYAPPKVTDTPLTGKKRKIPDALLPKPTKIITVEPFSLSIQQKRQLSYANDYRYNEFLHRFHNYYQHLLTFICQIDLSNIENQINEFYNSILNFSEILKNAEFLDIIAEKEDIAFNTILYLFSPNIITSSSYSVEQTRKFAKTFQNCISDSISSLPNEFQSFTKDRLDKFMYDFKTQCELNNLAGIFQQILNSKDLVSSMLSDFDETDIEYLNRKASSIHNIQSKIMYEFLLTVRSALQRKSSVSGWIVIFKTFCSKFESLCIQNSYSYILSTLTSFFSIILNDLTIRNAESFGSYHIIKTFFEEYLLYTFTSTKIYNSCIFDNFKPPFVEVIEIVSQEPPRKQPTLDNSQVIYNWDPPNFISNSYQPPTRGDVSDSSNPQNNLPSILHHRNDGNIPLPYSTSHLEDGNNQSIISINNMPLEVGNREYYFPKENIQRNGVFEFADYENRSNLS